MVGCFYSPAEMLFNRVIRSSLPVTSESLKPVIVSPTDQLRANQRVTKETYEKSAKALPNLNPGMPVFVSTDQQKEWTPGQIIDKHTAPRSYVVDVGKSVVRRNRVHRKPNYATTTTLNDNEIPTDEPSATTYNRSEIGSICDKTDAGHSSPSESRMHTRPDDVATTPLQRPVRQTCGSLPTSGSFQRLYNGLSWFNQLRTVDMLLCFCFDSLSTFMFLFNTYMERISVAF